MTDFAAQSMPLVPLPEQEREDAIRRDLFVLGRVQRGDRLLCGVGVTIENRQWAWQQINRYEVPFMATPGRDHQGRELTRRKVGIILDDAVQNGFILLQHLTLSVTARTRTLLHSRLEGVLTDLKRACSGVTTLIDSTYANDVIFESAMRIKKETVGRLVDTLAGKMREVVQSSSSTEREDALGATTSSNTSGNTSNITSTSTSTNTSAPQIEKDARAVRPQAVAGSAAPAAAGDQPPAQSQSHQ
jgi:hypothetical protein